MKDCRVTQTFNQNGTSVLNVKLNDTSMKCMKLLCNPPETWVENIVSSRCHPKCGELWKGHVKECLDEGKQHKCSVSELLIGSEQPTFKPRAKRVEHADGSGEIEVEIDAIYTACLRYLMSSSDIEKILCRRIEKEVDHVVEESIMNGTTTGKTKKELVLEFQPKIHIDPKSETNAEDIHSSRGELTNVKNQLVADNTKLESDLNTTRTEMVTDLQTTDTQLQTTRTELAETKTQIDEERTLHETTRTQLRNTQTELDVAKIKLLNIEARMQIIESNISKVVV
jgi:hypothetical protein